MTTPQDPADPADPAELRERLARYDEAGLIGKAAMRLSGEALSSSQRERLRREELGLEGRVAEDVVRVVEACAPIWSMLSAKGLPEDLSTHELNAIWECLLGRATRGWVETSTIDVSIKFRGSPLHVAALRRVIPGTTPEDRFDAYRYATLTTPGAGAVEPFVVALHERETPHNEVVATMLVAPTFLRHEEELGAFTRSDVEPLEDILGSDLAAVAETHEQLLGAPPETE